MVFLRLLRLLFTFTVCTAATEVTFEEFFNNTECEDICSTEDGNGYQRFDNEERKKGNIRNPSTRSTRQSCEADPETLVEFVMSKPESYGQYGKEERQQGDEDDDNDRLPVVHDLFVAERSREEDKSIDGESCEEMKRTGHDKHEEKSDQVACTTSCDIIVPKDVLSLDFDDECKESHHYGR